MQVQLPLEDIEAVVRPHLRLLAPNDPLAPDQSLGEAGLDSMASIELMLDLEEKFGLAIRDDLITETSFSSLVEIRKLLEESAT